MNGLNQNLTNSIVILKEGRRGMGEPPSLGGPEMRAFRIIGGGGALPSSRTGTSIEGVFLVGRGTCFTTSDRIERLATGEEIAAAGLIRGEREDRIYGHSR